MKRILILLLAAVIVVSFAACGKDKDDGPFAGFNGGIVPTLEQKTEQVQNMPSTSNGDEIENSIASVFGVNIDLPDGTYEADKYSANGVSVYAVTVSGANQTASGYYNAVKEEMVAKGYTPDDSELGFYKVVGNVVYSVGIEAEGDDIVVYTGVSDAAQMTPGGTTPGGTTPGGTTPGGTTPGGTIPGGTTPGGTTPVLPSGNLTEFPTATVNSMFSVLGINIPAFTAGSSYSIDEQDNDLSDGMISITVTCYGATADEREAHAQALKDVGFQSMYYLVYAHNVPGYGNLVAERKYNTANQTYTIKFWVTYEAPAYTLPQNLKVTYVENSYNYYTAVKIGNDYYLKCEYGVNMTFDYELYYKYNGSAWELWGNYGSGWEKDTYETTERLDYVENMIFGFMVEDADIDDEAVRGEDTTILGRTVNVYTLDMGYGGYSFTYYKDAETGILLKYEMMGIADEVTSIDTSVTSFGDVELPQ